MLLPCRNKNQAGEQSMRINIEQFLLFSYLNRNHKQNLKRKVILSPQKYLHILHDVRAFLFAPLRGSLTVEAALVLPIFLFCMIAALQYCRVMETSVRLAGGLTDTGRSMAAAAYLYEYPEDVAGSPGIAVSALSAAYAKQKVMKAAGDTSAIRSANMALSSFLQEDQMIDLVLTYQIKSPINLVKLPGNFFLQRAGVRAWTGRTTERQDEGQNRGGAQSGGTVYVTVTGSVYHRDLECTHLKLSIREVDRDALDGLRNKGGGKYHACEKCGSHAGDSVYITNEGNRYHSSLSCSGLKRTVREVTEEEAAGMRACSKCGNH